MFEVYIFIFHKIKSLDFYSFWEINPDENLYIVATKILVN